ncbi:hypothetical protein IFM89_012386 [Coptis chinensis]|uniref:Protein CutA, chloroplastic n=1 Tax=Coptis chinensis TaxID=261450 RepID=A0A835HPL9_9MAGN|nr:hypothetical protein IFM89_012386 [Coptis chinensis]
MASALCCKATSIISPSSSSSTFRRRLPLVGAFCILSLGLTNLTPSLSSSSSRFLSFTPFLRHPTNRSVHSSAMEGGSSIVVYVTVPNKEAGKKLAESIVKEKLAACVNRVPGVWCS